MFLSLKPYVLKSKYYKNVLHWWETGFSENGIRFYKSRSCLDCKFFINDLSKRTIDGTVK